MVIIIWAAALAAAAYLFAIALLANIQSITAQQARKKIDVHIRKILREAKKLFTKIAEWLDDKVDIAYLPDEIMIQSLLEAVEPFSLLDINLTKWQAGYYGNTAIPHVAVWVIPKADISCQALDVSIQNAIGARLAYCGVSDAATYIMHVKVSGNEVAVYAMYAVTDTQKQALSGFILARNKAAMRQAIKKLQALKDENLENDIKNGKIAKGNGTAPLTPIGYDVQTRVPIYANMLETGMTVIVGGTGSGKSVAALYLLYNTIKTKHDVLLYIGDFKKSGDYAGIANHYAEFSGVTSLIENFYEVFLDSAENSSKIRILLIDEYAGYITWLTQDNKKLAEEIKGKISTVLMMGRSRRCFVWCIQQRISAALFPPGIGAIDNYQICIGLGRLSPDSRKSLFAGEHLEDMDFENSYAPSTGQGIVLVDGQPLKPFQIPYVNKLELRKLLRVSVN